MRNWKLFVGLLLAFALIAAACGDDDDGTADTTAAPETTAAPTTDAAPETTTTTAAPATTTTAAPLPPLVVWADDKFGAVIGQVAGPFTEETGIEVEITVIDYDDMREQITTQAPAGEGPDVFIGAHDWLGEMVANGIAAPLDLGAAASNVAQVGLDAFSTGGSTYALPYAIEAIALSQISRLRVTHSATRSATAGASRVAAPLRTPITTSRLSPPRVATSSVSTRLPVSTRVTSVSTAKAPLRALLPWSNSSRT